MKKIILWSGIIFLFCLGACSEIIKLDLPLGNRRLVVEGKITDNPGPYRIMLTNTYEFTYTPKDTLLFEEGAVVRLTDDVGNNEILTEIQPGIYATDANGIRGVIGRSYTLQIATKGGKVYESSPELLRSVPHIDTIYASVIKASDDSLRLTGYFEFNDPPEEGNYFLSVYQSFNNSGQTFPVWTDALSDRFVNDKKISMRFINSTYLGQRTYLVSLYAISKEGYNFWTQLRYNIDQTGTPYDTPLAPDVGNIFNVADKNDYAIGYFFASSIRRTQFINR